MLIRLLASLNASHISVVFDAGSKTFRNDLYDKYKANRPPCPEDLVPQFPIIREAAESLNLQILEKVGYEADDLIATVAKKAEKKGFEVVIVSSDKDLMQLVGGGITMFDAMKNRIIGEKEVEEKFFVKPDKVLDVLSLMGDSSDNVPGVRGIGPKIAAELINQYGSLEKLLQSLDEIKQNKRRESLKEGVENAKLSKKLITLCEEVPMEIPMDDFKVKDIDPDKLIHFLEDQGFKSLVARVRKEFKIESSDSDLFSQNSSQNSNSSGSKTANSSSEVSFEKINKVIIKDIDQLRIINNKVLEEGNLIIDFEFDSGKSGALSAIILSTSLNANYQKDIYYIPLQEQVEHNADTSNDLFTDNNKGNDDSGYLSIDVVIRELKDILEDNSVIKIGYKVKELVKFFMGYDINLAPIDDIALMAYVLNSGGGKSDIRVLIDTNLVEDIEDNGFGVIFEEIEKGKIPQIFSDNDKKLQFYSFKSYAIWQLYNLLKSNIVEKRLNSVYYCFERPLIPILADMELIGISVNKIKLKSLSEEFDLKAKKLAQEIYSLAGEEFNIGSPKQLSEILFEKLGLKAGKKSKTGSFSTNYAILEELDLQGQVIAGKILEWRHISKLKSTYADALQKEVNSKTDRIHTTFSNISTSTGRLSSNNPNLQNIPIRTEEGLKIRHAFVAKKGHKLVSADYSQIELRVLAHMADIQALKKAFMENKDIHAITAAGVFGVKEDEVTSDMRRKAKAINFGIIYGISAFGLAKQLKIPRSDASSYIETYFETYPGIQDYMDKYQDLARKQGYVTTITGRKCFLPDINSKNPMLKGVAERLAINAPIQGSAADIVKKAMIDLHPALIENNFKSKMILQVHDELILEAPENEVEEVSNLLKSIMENSILLDLPLKVDIKISQYW